MTYQEALALRSYRHYCTCGGYAGMSERAKSEHPHLTWCAQYAEFEERAEALRAGPQTAPYY